MPVSVSAEHARQPDVESLLAASDAFALALYPAESCHLLSVDELDRGGVTVFVARDGGQALGMAALVDRGDGSAEIKRMFVTDSARGRGVAAGILDSLQHHALANGIGVIQLETGPLQDAALALYARHGFERIPNFGPYAGEEFSICMQKIVMR